MFRITDHRGVGICFDNGWTISIQWGPGNYSDHHTTRDYTEPRRTDGWQSSTAEVAITHRNGAGYDWRDGTFGKKYDHIEGWCSPDRVAQLIAIVVALPANPPVPAAKE